MDDRTERLLASADAGLRKLFSHSLVVAALCGMTDAEYFLTFEGQQLDQTIDLLMASLKEHGRLPEYLEDERRRQLERRLNATRPVGPARSR